MDTSTRDVRRPLRRGHIVIELADVLHRAASRGTAAGISAPTRITLQPPQPAPPQCHCQPAGEVEALAGHVDRSRQIGATAIACMKARPGASMRWTTPRQPSRATTTASPCPGAGARARCRTAARRRLPHARHGCSPPASASPALHAGHQPQVQPRGSAARQAAPATPHRTTASAARSQRCSARSRRAQSAEVGPLRRAPRGPQPSGQRRRPTPRGRRAAADGHARTRAPDARNPRHRAARAPSGRRCRARVRPTHGHSHGRPAGRATRRGIGRAARRAGAGGDSSRRAGELPPRRPPRIAASWPAVHGARPAVAPRCAPRPAARPAPARGVPFDQRRHRAEAAQRMRIDGPHGLAHAAAVVVDDDAEIAVLAVAGEVNLADDARRQCVDEVAARGQRIGSAWLSALTIRLFTSSSNWQPLRRHSATRKSPRSSERHRRTPGRPPGSRPGSRGAAAPAPGSRCAP